MRGGVVAAGIIMMIIGGVLFFLSSTQVAFWGSPTEGGGVGGYQTQNPLFLMLGLGLGVIGFIVFIAGLAASGKEKQVVPQTVVVQPSAAPKEPEALAICPKCGAHVSSKSKFCPECGANLGPKLKAKVRETEEEETEEPKKILKLKPAEGKSGFCMYCGTELPEGSDFCPECGKKVKKIE